MARISYEQGVLHVSGVEFDPQLTLMDSAQVFHWSPDAAGGHRATVDGRKVRLVSEKCGFRLEGATEEDRSFWRNYFDLGRDYAAIADGLNDWPLAQRAMRRLPGLRVLRQPVWETLIAFIISANNNVPRIRGLVQRISALSPDGGFPEAKVLAGTEEAVLRKMGCGYRAPYLIRAARMVADGVDLDGLRDLPYEAAHQALLSLPGVGDKVADCVQLFGLSQTAAFPVDVWVERLMKSWFLPHARDRREIREKAQEMFGEDAGIVQQSLFHCARLGLISLEEVG